MKKLRAYPEFVHKLYDLCIRFRFSLPIGGYPLHKNENYSPFFIIGSGRSGNTLLRRILCAHSRVFIPPETYILGKIIKDFRKYSNMPWQDLVSLIYSKFQFHPEFFTFEITSLYPLVKKVSQAPPEKRSLAFIIHNFYMFYAEIHKLNKDIWGDKTPINTLCLNRILSVFPKAKFIHIVRDPYDVIYSYVNNKICNSYKGAALRWKKMVNLAKKFGIKNKDKYLEIKYEKLVTNPEIEIKKLCSFLEIDFESQMLNSEHVADKLGDVKFYKHHRNVYKPISNENIGKGRKNLPLNVIVELNKIIKNDVKKFGYDLIEVN